MSAASIPHVRRAVSQFARTYARNRAAVVGLALLAMVTILAALAGWFYPRGPLAIVGERNIWPLTAWAHPFGTDGLGRDIGAILLHGARVSLTVALLAAVSAAVIGIAVGSLAGFYGGKTDNVLMRISELFQILPNLLFALVLGTILSPSLLTIVVAIAAVTWPSTARLARAEFLSLRSREFVLASEGLGMPDWQIIVRQMLPNALPPIIVLAAMQTASAMLVESALAFLGLSDPNLPSLGWLIGKGRQVLRTEWYISLLPGLTIMAIVIGINLATEGLNDALNPRTRARP